MLSSLHHWKGQSRNYGEHIDTTDNDIVMVDADQYESNDQFQRRRHNRVDEYEHSVGEGKPLEGIMQDFDQLNPSADVQNASASTTSSASSRSVNSVASPYSAGTSVCSDVPKEMPDKLLVAYLAAPGWSKGPLLLVKAGLGRGGFGAVTVWVSLVDHKLYLRKIQRGSKDKQPADISRYVPHANVPALLTFIKHGQVPRHFPSDRSYWWSTIHEFVDCPNLLKVITHTAKSGYRFPEPLVWKCGLTLLEIVQKLLFRSPRGSVNHNDIFPRNILVSLDDDPKSASGFQLIDFGIASMAYEQRLNSWDLVCISDVLYTMMLGYMDAHPRFAYNSPWTDRQMYSQKLHSLMWELWEKADSCMLRDLIYIGRNEMWLEQFIEDWRTQTDASMERHKSLGYDLRIPYKHSKIEPKIRAWQGDTAVQEMEEFFDNTLENGGCSPFQKAWVKPSTLEVIELDKNMTWC